MTLNCSRSYFLSVFFLGVFSANCLQYEYATAHDTTGGKPSKVIIDTDAGGDDAVAIAEIIRASQKKSPSIDILGITCVEGNTKVDNVVVNVLKILRVLNESKIPVYIGSNRPLLRKSTSDLFFGNDGLGDVPFPNPPTIRQAKKKSAVNALIDITSKYPGEVTVIALGPLTNIALASRVNPKFRSNIKDLIVLGGIINDNGTAPNGAEFNFYFDPDAASMVFNDTDSNIKPITQVTTDIQFSENIPVEWRWDDLAKIHTPIVEFLNKIEIKTWDQATKFYVPYDAFVATAYLTRDSVTSTESYCEEVLRCGEENLGLIVLRNDADCYKNVNIIRGVDTNVFKELLIHLFE